MAARPHASALTGGLGLLALLEFFIQAAINVDDTANLDQHKPAQDYIDNDGTGHNR